MASYCFFLFFMFYPDRIKSRILCCIFITVWELLQTVPSHCGTKSPIHSGALASFLKAPKRENLGNIWLHHVYRCVFGGTHCAFARPNSSSTANFAAHQRAKWLLGSESIFNRLERPKPNRPTPWRERARVKQSEWNRQRKSTNDSSDSSKSKLQHEISDLILDPGDIIHRKKMYVPM